jgi:hypothetical protein
MSKITLVTVDHILSVLFVYERVLHPFFKGELPGLTAIFEDRDLAIRP